MFGIRPTPQPNAESDTAPGMGLVGGVSSRRAG
jgi:hypothetical protein